MLIIIIRVLIYTIVVLLVYMFACILIKKGFFCGINFENAGMILRIIGKFKKNFQKEQLKNLKA